LSCSRVLIRFRSHLKTKNVNFGLILNFIIIIIIFRLGKLWELKAKLREAEDEMVKALAGTCLCLLSSMPIGNLKSVLFGNFEFEFWL
jgi:hypothetical protein